MSELVLERAELPTGSIRYRASGWWGMLGIILSEAALFGYLLFSYYYLAVQQHSAAWPPTMPELKLSLPDTIILILSSVAVWWGERAIKEGERLRAIGGVGVGLLLGIVFVVVQVFEWKSKSFSINSHPYGSLYFTITGFHMAHVIVGVILLAVVTWWMALDYFGRYRNAAVATSAIYWHFVDVVWLAIFFTFYITPRLGFPS
jgi:heme/copper-type cytochrome/quinol oxidase subunit 3